MTEAEILALLQAGKVEEGFLALYQSRRGPMLALCRQVTGDEGLAEDALQEALWGIHQGLGAFRGQARLSTWVWRVTLRAALRVAARRAPTEPLHEALPAAGADPELRGELARVERAMAALSLEHRAVLALFAVEGLRHAEIAEALGIPEGTVWSRLHAARRRLLETLGEP